MIDGKTEPEHYDKSEWIKEEKVKVPKDTMVRYILHNTLDDVCLTE